MITKSNGIILKPKYFASVSGGKDSLYMLKIITNNPLKYPLDGVVHFELEIDFPFVKNVINYIENECKRFRIPFFRIRPRESWSDLYNKYGFPTRKNRWCNSKYKLDCSRQLKTIMPNYRVINYVGLCYDEEQRFKHANDVIYPLVEERVIESDILKWARTVKLFNNYYNYIDRCGCMFCPFMSLKEFKYLKDFYPTEFEFLVKHAYETEMKMSSKLGRKFSVWSSNPKYDTIYRLKRVNNM